MADECSFCAERRSTAIVRDDVILAHTDCREMDPCPIRAFFQRKAILFWQTCPKVKFAVPCTSWRVGREVLEASLQSTQLAIQQFTCSPLLNLYCNGSIRGPGICTPASPKLCQDPWTYLSSCSPAEMQGPVHWYIHDPQLRRELGGILSTSSSAAHGCHPTDPDWDQFLCKKFATAWSGACQRDLSASGVERVVERNCCHHPLRGLRSDRRSTHIGVLEENRIDTKFHQSPPPTVQATAVPCDKCSVLKGY